MDSGAKFLGTVLVLVTNAAAAAKSLQSCPTLCDPIDGSPLGSSVPGILQARILEWGAIAFSNAWKSKVKVKVKSLSCVRLCATPWTAPYQAPPSMRFSRQEYWSGLPLPPPWLPIRIIGELKKHPLTRLHPRQTISALVGWNSGISICLKLPRLFCYWVQAWSAHHMTGQ